MSGDGSSALTSEQYWERYYASANLPSAPSQFAVFMWGEVPAGTCIVDVGCGAGRDTFFFAQQGAFTIGLDRSRAAIEFCHRRRRELNVTNARFHCASVSDPGLPKEIDGLLAEAGNAQQIAVYARFFLHAIAEREEAAFLQFASDLMASRGGCLGVEFRTLRDRAQTKVMPDHFRRFIDPVRFINLSEESGFTLAYFVEGFGYAKYKEDDAHVARCIFTRNSNGG